MKKTFLNTLTPEEIIKRLKAGEVIKCKDSDNVIYLVDSILISDNDEGNVTFGSCFLLNNQTDYLYFEEEEPFIITETGVYKTRDGKKAFVYEIDDETDDVYPINYILENKGHCYSITKQGKIAINKESPLDIVAKWED